MYKIRKRTLDLELGDLSWIPGLLTHYLQNLDGLHDLSVPQFPYL
jgi:hypothetical protein